MPLGLQELSRLPEGPISASPFHSSTLFDNVESKSKFSCGAIQGHKDIIMTDDARLRNPSLLNCMLFKGCPLVGSITEKAVQA
ncbi:MAG: hypothetical protein DKT66_01855 [Candidatus Melainabacteria bacterium]|nr:MAG: hypothetical protein DKT66_01855 [Candidatus Melainabacteria bacterium]